MAFKLKKSPYKFWAGMLDSVDLGNITGSRRGKSEETSSDGDDDKSKAVEKARGMLGKMSFSQRMRRKREREMFPWKRLNITNTDLPEQHKCK